VKLEVEKRVSKTRIAVATNGRRGLEDSVSEVFGKAKTFTIIDLEDGEVKDVQVVDNPAASYRYGSGPVASKTLADLKVNSVMATQFGPGASGLLEHHNIGTISVRRNKKVAACIREALSKSKGSASE
jgi:predicted Fe-Mo cluster-binding NifX family protein